MWHWLLIAGLMLPVSQEYKHKVLLLEGLAGQSPTLSFCQQRFYREEEGRLLCNWAVDFRFACFASSPSKIVIQAGSKITEPEVIGACDDGELIIKLLHY